MIVRLLATLLVSSITANPLAIGQTPAPADFREVVEKRLKQKFNADLEKVCPVGADWVAARVFAEYGAIYLAEGVKLPPKCIYDTDDELEFLQQAMDPQTTRIGTADVTLQRPAMIALQAARREAAKAGLTLTPRGGLSASTRSYSKTVELWGSRFKPALAHWERAKKIPPADAAAARRGSPIEQVSMVLIWEQQRLWFSTNRDKSILYSVAAPGASQHNFMLALDIAQFADTRVRAIMAKHGWFQTVKSDMPHFTYLGLPEESLPGLGLKMVTIDGQKFWIPNVEIPGGEK